MSHMPVLLTEMLAALSPQDGEVYVDGTFGGGGYSRAILESADCRVIGLDRDPDAVKRGKCLEEDFPGRFTMLQGTFGNLKELLNSKVHGFVFDLGVSSYQIDEADRGFSFRFEGPLDMRMSGEGISAADVVNTYSEEDLANIIFQYGEERKSRVIARRIVESRKTAPFKTTHQLATLVKSVVKSKGDGQHPATLTFQALRIFVNNELIEIDQGLKTAQDYLLPGGRLVVVTFHSLEDRLVKLFLKDCQGNRSGGTRYLPDQENGQAPTFALVHPKGIKPGDDEVHQNPRARSARLRAAIRLPDRGES
jgi:16S rRNA (cytosine1402-N4)-methyltransferase